MWRTLTPAVLAIVVACTPLAATEEQVVSFTPEHDELCHTFGGCEAKLRVAPGAIVETWTEDCYDGCVKKPDDRPTQTMAPNHANPQTGPFFIEGAEPGDTIAVTILKLEPARDHGVSAAFPGAGILTTTHRTALLHDLLPEKVWFYPINKERGTVTFKALAGNHEVEIPMRPFLGCIGVAPSGGEVRSSIVPGEFGGNLDTPELGVGTTLYLGVNVPGALLSVGDGHLVQGGGEIVGTAVEAAMHVSFKVELIKDRYTPWPLAENDTHIIAIGSTRPLEDAYRVALKEMVLWLERDYQMERMDALQLLSQAGEAEISQVVDPAYTVVAKIQKRYLPQP
jgi:acetamidase/formamidase